MKRKALLTCAACCAALLLTCLGVWWFCFHGREVPEPPAVTPTAAPTAAPTAVPEATAEPVDYQARLEEARAVNPDAVGWLTIPNTEIDDVVMQSTDNDYYLRRDWTGAPDTWGCYFADYINDLTGRDTLSPNNIIYGHSYNTEDTSYPKFTQLFKYCDIDFVRENPTITLHLDGETLTFQVAAVFYTDIGFDYINPVPPAEFYSTVAAKNEYIFDGIELTAEDTILTLSTCSYKYDVNNTHNHRLVVMAELLDAGAAPKAVTVSANPDPQRPAA